MSKVKNKRRKLRKCPGMAPSHTHRSTHKKHWLPLRNEDILQPHPVCGDCGTVKNISFDRARGLGYYVNVLGEIRGHLEGRGLKLSIAQIRLIVKELEGMEIFSDTYATLGSVQRDLFIRTVRKYTSLSPSFVQSFL